MRVDLDIRVDHTVSSSNKNSTNLLPVFPRPRWHDCDFQKLYEIKLTEALCQIPLDIPEDLSCYGKKEFINSHYDSLCTAMHSSVQSCLKTDGANVRKRKHWWNFSCKKSRDRNKNFHSIWKSCGRPRSGSVYNCYKHAHTFYRKSCRDAVKAQKLHTFEITEQSHRERNTGKLWNIIRKTKQKSSPAEAVSMDNLITYFSNKFITDS